MQGSQCIPAVWNLAAVLLCECELVQHFVVVDDFRVSVEALRGNVVSLYTLLHDFVLNIDLVT